MLRMNSLFAILLAVLLTVFLVPFGLTPAYAEGSADIAIGDNSAVEDGVLPGRDPGVEGITANPSELELNLFSGGTAKPSVSLINKSNQAFSFKAEVEVTAQPGGVMVNPDPAGKKFLVMQDQSSWGWLYSVIVGRVAGAQYEQMTDYTKIGSPNLDLFAYDAVLVAFNVQSANWQNALIANRAWFEDYVSKGGALYIESGGNSGSYWEVPLPGNIPSYYGATSYGRVILNPGDNKLVQMCNWAKDMQLQGSSWNHQYYKDADFKNAPLKWYQIIATTWDYADRACIIAYGMGSGGVLVYGGPVGHNWANYNSGNNVGAKPKEFLTYLLSFRQSNWLTVTPEAGAVGAGRELPATLVFDATELKEGLYEANVKFVSTADKNQYHVVPVTMNVKAAGKLEAKWTVGSGYPVKVDYNANFPELYDTGLYNIPVTISNKGNKELKVTDVKFIGSQNFKVRRAQFAVAPGKSYEMQVGLRAMQSGRHNATMAIYSDDPYKPVLEIPVTGETKVPPVITVNVEQIEDEIYTGDVINEELTIGNAGRANLNYKTKYEVTSPPARAIGQEVRQVQWRGAINGGWNTGLAWDEQNQRMWVTSYNNNWIAALDKNGNEVVGPFGAASNPFGAAWANNRLYVTYQNDYYIYMYDGAGNNLGNFYNNGNWSMYRMGLAYDPETGIFMAGYNSHYSYLYFFKHTPQTGYQYLGSFTNLYGLRNNIDSYYPRSMTWVPSHKGGNLWLTSYNYVWQYDVNPTTMQVTKLTNSFMKPFASRSEYDGIGHDGENLWLKRYDSQIYYVLSDGIEENPWLKVAFEGGVTEGTLKTNQEINGYIIVDARGRAAGDFKGKVVIESNDPIAPTIVIPIDVTVQAAPRLKVYWSAGYPDVVDYNKAFQGIFIDRNYQITLNVKNEGTERLNVQDIEDGMGWYTPNVRQFSLDPGKSQNVVVTFRDGELGDHESVLTFMSNDPDEILDLPMNAVTSLPPIIDVDPQQINEQVSTGQRFKAPVTVANEGDSPLYYNVTGGGDAGQAGANLGSWQWNRNTNNGWQRAGISYDKDRNWMWLSNYQNAYIGAVALPNRNEATYWYCSWNGNPMDIAYYNNIIYTINWSYNGLGRWNTGGGNIGGWAFNYRPRAVAVVPEKGYILTINDNDPNQLVVHDINNGAEIKRVNGLNALWPAGYYARSMEWVSAHTDGELWITPTWSDGRNHFVQVKFDMSAWTLTRVREFPTPVANNDEWNGVGHDGKNLWYGPSNPGNGSYYFIDDGFDEDRWVWYKPETGVVQPGESEDVWFTLDASRLAAGNYNKNITIKSNENNDVVVQVAIQVVNSPNAEVIWDTKHGYPDVMDYNQRFGDVIANQEYKYAVVVKNNGTQNLQIESIFAEGDNADFYSADPEAINQLTPGQSANVTVTFSAPEDEGEYPAELVLLTNGNPNDVVRYDMYARVDGAPAMVLDPEDGIMVDLITNDKVNKVLTVSNEGRGPLRVSSSLVIVDEPERDGSVYGEAEAPAVRKARKLGDGSIPTRDGKLGDELGKVTWRYNANGYMNMGVSWDEANQRMWVTNYNNNMIAAIDKSGNEVVVAFSAGSNPGDCVWANDRLYVTYNNSSNIYMYDGNRNNLGTFSNSGNWNCYRIGIAYDPETKIFMAGDNNDWGQLRFFKHSPQTGYQYLGNFYGLATLRNNQDGYYPRSMTWVPAHKGGQLWVTSYNYIWQFDVDPANIKMNKLTSSLQKPWGSRSEYDGVGHDGENLWLKRYDTNEYIIIDDGIIEFPWVIVPDASFTLQPGESEEIAVKFDARNRSGSYKAQLKLSTNDPNLKNVAYPVELNAIPVAKMEMTWSAGAGYPNNVNFNGAFGTVYTRQKYEVGITINNKGNGRLDIDNLKVDGEAFTSDPSRDFTILAGKSRVLKVIVNTPESGVANGVISFTTNDPLRENVSIAISANLTGAAAMVLDREEFEHELATGGVWNAGMNIGNEGESQLTFALTGALTQVAARDDGVRRARTLGDLDETREIKWSTPLRDGKAGDLLGTVKWRYKGANQYNSLAWDEQNQRMWVTSYNQNMIAAIDRNGNEVVGAKSANNNPTDACWAEGRLYVTYNTNYYINMFDGNGNYLGNFYNNGNWDIYRMGIAYDPETQTFMAGSNGNWTQLSFFKYTPQTGYQYKGAVTTLGSLRNNQDSYYPRSMTWVPGHRGGNLWLTSYNYIWQYDVDPAAMQVKSLKSSIQKPWASRQEYDGVGHDGKNLWLSRYDADHYGVIEDGLKEVPLLTFEPRTGAVQPNENLDVDVIFNTYGLVGRLTGKINITTNVGLVSLPVDIKIGGGAHLDLSWDDKAGYPNKMDFNAVFPEVYAGKNYRIPLEVSNPGSEWLDIDKISFEAPADVYSVNEDQFSLGPKESAKINVTLSAGEGDIGDVGGFIVFASNDPNREEYRLPISAIVGTPPVINIVNDDDIEAEVVANESSYYPLFIENIGGSPLRVELESEEVEDARRDLKLRQARQLGTGAPTRDAIVLTGVYGVFQDGGAWGWLDDNMMNKTGTTRRAANDFTPGTHHTFRSANDLNTVDFTKYTALVFNLYGNSAAWVNNYNANLQRLTDYVAGGGACYFETGNSQNVKSPGNITNDVNSGSSNGQSAVTYDKNAQNYSLFAEICNAEQGGNRWGTGHVVNGSSWSHSYYSTNQFTNNPALKWHQVLFYQQNTQNWAVVAYGIGKGICVTFSTPTGHQWANYNSVGNWGSISKELLLYLELMGSGSAVISFEKGEVTINPNERKTFDLTLGPLADAGQYEAVLMVNSNDPATPLIEIPVKVAVVDGPDIAIEWPEKYGYPSKFDWDAYIKDVSGNPIYVEANYQYVFEVSNPGTEVLSVDLIQGDNEDLFANPDNFALNPEQKREVTITLNTVEVGESVTNLMFFSNDPNEPEMMIPMHYTAGIPPEITLEWDWLEESVGTGGWMQTSLNIGNAGAVPLNIKLEAVDPEQRRDGPEQPERQARRLDEEYPVGPTRDALGQELRRVQWARVPSNSQYKSGISFDADHNWLWLGSYTQSCWGAIDLKNNNQEVKFFSVGTRPMEITYLNGVVYVWPYSNAYLNRYDINGNSLGDWNLGFTPRGVAADREKKNLFIYNQSNNSILVYRQADMQQIGTIANVTGFAPNAGSGGNMEWVPEHPKGQLWINSTGRAYQLAINPANWTITGKTAEFGYALNSMQTWDGIGHDGTDIWIGCYGESQYVIFDDGIKESRWFKFAPETAVIEPDESTDILITLDAGRVDVGRHVKILRIHSNDPINPIVDIEITLDAVASGFARVTLPGDDEVVTLLDWNAYFDAQEKEVYSNGKFTIPVEITNSGKQALTIEDIAIDDNDGVFSTDRNQFVNIQPDAKVTLNVSFEAEEPGQYGGDLWLLTDAAVEPVEIKLGLRATALAGPLMVLNPEEIDLGDMVPGQKKFQVIDVSNEGAVNLSYEVELVLPEERAVARDGGVRNARRLDEGRGAPYRDPDPPKWKLAYFQDQAAWGGWPYNGFGPVQGLQYDRLNSNQFANFDIDAYGVVFVVNSEQPDAFNNAHNNIRAKLEAWVDKGGVYYSGTGTNQYNVKPIHPGGLTYTQGGSSNGTVRVQGNDPGNVATYNYLAQLMNWQKDVTVLSGSSLFHVQYAQADIDRIQNSDFKQTIVSQQNNNIPGIVVYNYGKGWCVVAGTTDGHQHQNFNGAPNWGSAADELVYYLMYLRDSAGGNIFSLIEGDVSEILEDDWKDAKGPYIVRPDASHSISLVADATELEPGIYSCDVVFTSNGGEASIPVMMNVFDAPAISVIPGGDAPGVGPVDFTTTDFGTTYVDYPEMIEIELFNVGSARLMIDGIETDQEFFDLHPADPRAFDVEVGESQKLRVIYNPGEPGIHEGNLWVISNDGREEFADGYPIRVTGLAQWQPEMWVSPDDLSRLVIPAGFQENISLEISNAARADGGGDLHWWAKLRKADPQVRDLQAPERQARRLGEGFADNGFASRNNAPTRDAVGGMWAVFQDQSSWGWLADVMVSRVLQKKNAGQFDDNGYHDLRNPADWNTTDFFAYDGLVISGYNNSATWTTNYNNNFARFEEYIAKGGAAYMETRGVSYAIKAPGGIMPVDDYGSAYGKTIISPDPANPKYSLLAKLAQTQLGANYWNMGHQLYGTNFLYGSYDVTSFQNKPNISWSQPLIAHRDRGNDNLPGVVAYKFGRGGVMVCAILPGYVMTNFRGTDGWGAIPGPIMEYMLTVAEGLAPMQFVEETGVVPPQETRNLDIFVDASMVKDGKFEGIIELYSNDPILPEDRELGDDAEPDISVPVVLTVRSKMPFPEFYPKSLNFGENIVGQNRTMSFNFSNIGNDLLEIAEIAITDEENYLFDPELEFPVVLAPGSDIQIPVTYFGAAPGLNPARLEFRTNVPNADDGLLTYPLRGYSFTSPTVAIEPEALEIELDALMGETGVVEFAIQNTADPEDEPGVLRWTTLLRDPNEPERGIGRMARRIDRPDFRNEAVPTRDEPTSRFALFAQANPWGYNLENIFRNVDDLNYDRYESMDNFDQVDLNHYGVIWFGNNQIDRWNTIYNNNLARIEEWVDRGGVYYMSSGTTQWTVAPKHPGGLVRLPHVYNNSATVVVDPLTNELVRMAGWQKGEQLVGASFSHTAYSIADLEKINNSDYYQVIVEGDQARLPVTVMYQYGHGYCVVSGTNDGFLHATTGNKWGEASEWMVWYLDGMTPKGDSWISLAPPSGKVPAGEQQTVSVKVDAGKVQGEPGQTFDYDIVVKTNDVENPELAVRVTLKIMTDPEWVVTPSRRLQKVEVTEVTLDGYSARGLYLGAYTGDVFGGFTRWFDTGPVVLTLYGDNLQTEEVEGFKPGEKINFLLYDKRNDITYKNLRIEQIEGGPLWALDGYSKVRILANSRSAEEEQTITLKKGWNLISLNVEAGADMFREGEDRGADIVKMTANMKKDNKHYLVLMKNAAGQFYTPQYGFNNIPYWDAKSAYWVKMDSTMDVSWTGAPFLAADPIPLTKGVNFVAYYPDYELTVNAPDFHAVQSIAGSIDILKDGSGKFALPKFGWSNIGTMKPGQGYIVKMSADAVLSYPGRAIDVAGVEAEVAVPGHWAMSAVSDQNMSVLVKSVKGYVPSAGDQIGAFDANGNLVGVGSFNADGSAGVAVFGDDPTTDAVEGLSKSAPFELRIWNSTDRTELKVVMSGSQYGNGLSYQTDGLSVIDVSAVALPTEYYVSSAYPNPFNAVTRLNYGMPDAGLVKIAVFDVTGRLVQTLYNGNQVAGHHTVVWSSKATASGIYLIKVESGAFRAVKKVTLLK